ASPSEYAEHDDRIHEKPKEEGRAPAAHSRALYHNINNNEDRQAGLEESKKYLDAYYSTNFTAKFVEQWTISGDPKSCAAELRAYADAGLGHMALRLTSWDQRGQLRRLLDEVVQ